MKLKDLLTKDPLLLVDGKRDRIFRFQSNLVDDILKSESEYKNKDVLKNLLSQVLRPSSRLGSRSMPEALKKSIIKVVLPKLSPSIRNQFIDKFNEILNNVDTDELEDVTIAGIKEYNDLKEWNNKATDIHVFTREPAEFRWKFDTEIYEGAHKFVEILYDRFFEETETDDVCKYHFYLPNVEKYIGIRYWDILTEIINSVGIKRAKVKTKAEIEIGLDNKNKAKRIRVFTINPEECAFSCCYFETKELILGQNRMLFNLYYIIDGQTEKTSIARMSSEDVEFWFTHKFENIKYNPETVGLKEITFEQFLNSKNGK